MATPKTDPLTISVSGVTLKQVADRLRSNADAIDPPALPGRKVATVTAPKAPAKAGWKTTEFYLTLLTGVGAAAAAAGGSLPPRYAAFASALSVSAYAFSRALAKR